ncbi:MAG: GNAT family N-acetyltransferase [Candidatus Thorarchaeota archaeon]|jgi:GNAT superfamily N-acetyltransferase
MRKTAPAPYNVTKRDMEKVIETLVQAFIDDHLLGYFFPEPETRLRFLPKFFNYRVKNGLLYGKVLATSENIEGVVILTQSKYNEFSWLRAIRTGGIGLYRTTGSEILSRMREVESFVINKRDECISEPHWYLGSLAVHPDYQGKGLASKLVRPVLEMCSSQNKPCVLETQGEGLVEVYKHYGFDVIDSFILPTANLPHWVMVKQP